jgi:hypothetical protein
MNAEQSRGMWELDLHGLHAPEVLSSFSFFGFSEPLQCGENCSTTRRLIPAVLFSNNA